MIRKLLKVEFRDALSSMLPIGVGMVALSALVALTSVLTGRLGFHFGHWNWLNALLSFATGVCFIAVLVVCFAANVNRFFRMLGMKRIGRCDVDDIGIGSQHLIQIGVDGTDAMALCQRKRMIARASIHACAADPLQLFDSLQEQIRDEACSDGNDV